MRFEHKAFKEKYQAQVFDESNRLDMLAERSRRRLISAFLDVIEEEHPLNGEELQYIMGGLMVGVACVGASHHEMTDENHASLRAGLIQLTPWAVDMMRQIGDDPMPPLSDAT